MDYLKLVQSRCTDESLILDLGANIGGHTFLFLGRPGKIHCFEPCPKLAEGIRERYKDEPRVKVFQLGVSDKEFKDSGYTVFEAWTLDKPDRAKRGVSQGAVELVGKELFDIEFTTVDAHITKENPKSVDFIKIDVDGYELRALKGAYKTIMHFRPYILIEVSYLIDDIGDSVVEFLNYVYNELGYKLYTCDTGEEKTLEWMKENFPWHTSYDMIMLPKEVNIKDLL